ncbi:MAG: acyltransferase family protein [Nocardioides sp.]
MSAPSPAALAPRERLLWVDVAKGLCILLVVLHHAVVKDLAVQAPPALAPVADGWAAVTMALKPVRMPLFFVLSGLVAAGAVTRPWPQARRRVLSPYYLYVVWLVLQGAFFSVERLLPMNRTQDLAELAGDLVWASTGLWFLYALAVYFALARLLSRFPRERVLLVATAVSALSGLVPTEAWNRTSVLFHFTFFALGALAPDLVRRVADRVGDGVSFGVRDGAGGLLPRLALLYLALVVLLPLVHLPRTVDLLVASAVGVPLGIGLCVRLARGPAAERLAWIGRRTLPVYVLHAPLLALALHLPEPLRVSPLGRGYLGWIEAAAYPVVLTGLAVAAALVMHAGLRRCGASALFALPQRPGGPGVAGRAQATVAARS